MRPGTPGFRGERLREARESRGLTATTLAGLVGVTRAAVSQYENCLQSPSPQVMRQIARGLNLPVEFFLREALAGSSGVVFYRSMSSATKRSRTSAQRRYGWLRSIVAFLREYIRFPDVRFPDLDVPPDPTLIDWSLIESLAMETRWHFGLGDGPVSNIAWLLENHGAVVTRCDLDAQPLDAFSEWRRDEETPYIVLNSHKESAARSRFDVAHELAHMVLHRHLPSLPQREDKLFKTIEAQANHFASAFLLPASTFQEEAIPVTLEHCLRLKTKWCVSVQAMLKRAGQLGIISEEQERRLWVNLGRRKWRTREPLDEFLSPERPKFLQRSVELLVQSGLIDPLNVSERLSLAPSDIEELAGLPAGYLGVSGPRIELVSDDERDTIPFDDEAVQG